MKNIQKIDRLLMAAFIVSLPILSIAQPGFDDDVLDNPVPFDGGVSMLIAAGIAYGLKKAWDKKSAKD